MLSLQIRPQDAVVKSGKTLDIDIDVDSTRDADVQVVLHFPSSNASLDPHTVTVKVKRKQGSPIRQGHEVLRTTIKGKKAWYALLGRATDGDSESHAQTMISVLP
jgi:YbbR domain-containing protein